LSSGLGPTVGEKYRQLGRRANREFPELARLFRLAQRKVERRHFRDRSVLLYHEKQRKKMQRELGQDPYLDTAD
jgi:preprotein translocase subunit SecA